MVCFICFVVSVCKVLLECSKFLSSSTEHCTDFAMRYDNSELDKNYARLQLPIIACDMGHVNIVDK